MSKSSSSSSRRVSFSSASDQPAVPRNKKRSVITLFWAFRVIPKSAARFSPETFLRRLRANVAKVLRYVSFKKRSSSSKKNPSPNSSNFNRSHSVSDHSMEESHRAEAVKDCINFINSSSSSV